MFQLFARQWTPRDAALAQEQIDRLAKAFEYAKIE